MANVSRVGACGPLGPFVAGFAAELSRQGYKSQPVGKQIRLLAALSGWLASEGVAVSGLSSEVAERFCAARRAAGHTDRVTVRALLAQTGLRASELTGLDCGDIHLGTGAHATTTGKGRKQRITPLTKQTAAVLRGWLAQRGSPPTEPLFPTSTGKPLTRKALSRRIANHAAEAAKRCQSLNRGRPVNCVGGFLVNGNSDSVGVNR